MGTITPAEPLAELYITRQFLPNFLRQRDSLAKVLPGLLKAAVPLRHFSQVEAASGCPGAKGEFLGELRRELFEDFEGGLERSVRIRQTVCVEQLMPAQTKISFGQLRLRLLGLRSCIGQRDKVLQRPVEEPIGVGVMVGRHQLPGSGLVTDGQIVSILGSAANSASSFSARMMA